ncbi:MAG: cytochrome c3 family protein [Polyangiaceae bacterium]
MNRDRTTLVRASARRLHRIFPAILAGSALVALACGDATPTAKSPSDAVVSGPAAEGVGDSGAPTPSKLPTSTGQGSTTAPGKGDPAPVGAMPPVVPSRLAADLQAIGLDPKALPTLDKISGDKLRKVMRTFTRALGAKCSDCHADDFSAPTDAKIIAERMWNDFTRTATVDGQPLYCDSCHQGRMKFLERGDKKALSTWMDHEFVDRLTRTDGKEPGCDPCHGDTFEGHIFTSLWLPQAKAKGKGAGGKAGIPTGTPPKKP